MARNRKLTWQPGAGSRTGRWRKNYYYYYFPGGRGKTDEVAYQSALASWERRKLKIDAQAPKPHQEDYESGIDIWEKALSWSRLYHEEGMANIAIAKLAKLRSNLSNPTPPAVDKKDTFDGQFDRSVRYPGWNKMIKQVVKTLDATLKNSTDVHRFPGQAELRKASDDFLARNSALESSVEGRKVIVPSEHGLDAPDPLVLEHEIWRDRLAIMSRSVATDQTLKAHVTDFLEVKKATARTGDITDGRVEKLRIHLDQFQQWVGPDLAIEAITGQVLVDYRLELLRMVDAKVNRRTTARDKLGSVKSFVRWLWEMEAIESLPRVLDPKSKTLEISKSAPEIIDCSKEEIQKLLKNASDRTRIYLLLMLNCGMTQKDIADLDFSEIDWKKGRIKRKRSKTRDHKNVPTVDYLLWPETLQLLHQERNPKGTGRALVNQNGSALWRESNDEKYSKNDNIRTAFGRLTRKLKITKPLKSLKKTSASMLRGNKDYQGLQGHFLGHSPKSIADQHYAKPPTALLDEAIMWLRDEFGIAGLELM